MHWILMKEIYNLAIFTIDYSNSLFNIINTMYQNIKEHDEIIIHKEKNNIDGVIEYYFYFQNNNFKGKYIISLQPKVLNL